MAASPLLTPPLLSPSLFCSLLLSPPLSSLLHDHAKIFWCWCCWCCWADDLFTDYQLFWVYDWYSSTTYTTASVPHSSRIISLWCNSVFHLLTEKFRAPAGAHRAQANSHKFSGPFCPLKHILENHNCISCAWGMWMRMSAHLFCTHRELTFPIRKAATSSVLVHRIHH